MTKAINIREVHPANWRYRVTRWFRVFRKFRGWRRLADIIAPPGIEGRFVVINDDVVFEGNLSSYIDRQVYLFGKYEEERIKLFFTRIPQSRRNVILDIGANVGTHTILFAKEFKQVHSFEPNPTLWASFERNAELNSLNNVILHKAGLADVDALQPFYLIAKNNMGLGTFSSVEQYDLPLEVVGNFRILNGDSYVKSLGLNNIDAIKLDVQDYEPEVLRGLVEALRKHQPIVWLEHGGGTKMKLSTVKDIKGLFPYDVDIFQMASQNRIFTNMFYLMEAPEGVLPLGDYLVIPRPAAALEPRT